MNWLNLLLLTGIYAFGIGTGWEAHDIIREHQEKTMTTPDPQRKTVADIIDDTIKDVEQGAYDTPIPSGIRCGCGFTVNTGIAASDIEAHDDHYYVCPNRPARAHSWIGDIFDAIFSGPTVAIVFIVAVFLALIFGK